MFPAADWRRRKDGKTHVYWNIVENRRLDDGRVVQHDGFCIWERSIRRRPPLERQAIEVFDTASGEPRTLAHFPDRAARRWPMTP